jgi:hypothetical protein
VCSEASAVMGGKGGGRCSGLFLYGRDYLGGLIVNIIILTK